MLCAYVLATPSVGVGCRHYHSKFVRACTCALLAHGARTKERMIITEARRMYAVTVRHLTNCGSVASCHSLAARMIGLTYRCSILESRLVRDSQMVALAKILDWNSFRANQDHSESYRHLYPSQWKSIPTNPKKVFNLISWKSLEK